MFEPIKYKFVIYICIPEWRQVQKKLERVWRVVVQLKQTLMKHSWNMNASTPEASISFWKVWIPCRENDLAFAVSFQIEIKKTNLL